jgi:transcriptional regulator with XRE-family HTH domain
MEEVGARLRRLRDAAGLTQEALAARAGLGVRTIRDLELGVSGQPHQRTVQRLAEALRLEGAERDSLLEQARTARIVGNATRRADERGGGPVADAVHSLPRDLPELVGRDEQIRALVEEDPAAAVIVGGPGIGKTALVTHAAHRLRGTYPTVAYAQLGDLAGPATGSDALGQLLIGLGVEPGQVPASDSDRLAAYRRLTSGRRGVLVLDDARTESQVLPLLPAGPGWRVLIASRRRLAQLPVGRRITLDVLEADAAVRLLAGAVGPERVGREPAAAAELVDLCGGLPLALRAVASRIANRPLWTLQSFVERLADPGRRLGRLSGGAHDVRGAIEASYRELPPAAQRALRRLSRGPGSDQSLDVLGVDVEVREALLDSGLLSAGATGRVRLHPLTALYCAEHGSAVAAG